MIKAILPALTFFIGSNYLNILGQGYCDLKYDFVWIMGGIDNDTVSTDEYGGNEINFNYSPPIFALHPKQIRIPFQNTSMSTKEGTLIFYSNGCAIFNSLDTIMDNGDSLNPGEPYEIKCPDDGYVGFQNMFSLPSLYNDSLFYLFHIAHIFNRDTNAPFLIQPKFLYYSVINRFDDGGLGMVIKKNVEALIDTGMLGSPMTAVKHAHGNDWWIVTPDRWTNGINKILVHNNGTTFIDKQHIGIPPDPSATAGQGKFSPDGNHFAWYHPKNDLFLYDFDRETGLLSNFRLIEIPYGDFITGGCEFSPNSQYLYINHDTSLFQIDILADDVQESLTHIADYDGFGDPLPTVFFFMERTPDDRIIMNVLNGSQYLHVIQEPDKKGTACRFEQHAIKLPTVNNFTLPHFPNYRLGAIDQPLCDSMGVSTDEISKKADVWKIIPNPAFDEIYILPPKHLLYADYFFEVFDSFGKAIYYSTNHEIDINNLSAGLYFVRIRRENVYVGVLRFIKMHAN